MLLKLVLSVFILSSLISTSYANTSGAYIVEGVEVSLPAGSVSIRREEALEQAAQKGLAQLLQRLTPESDWDSHAAILERTDAEQTLNRFDIVSEETGRDEYKAIFSLTYSRPMVREILTRQGQTFMETVTRNGVSLTEVVQTDTPGRAFVGLTPSKVEDIENVKEALEGLSAVHQVRLKLVSLQDAVFQVDYFGEQPGFIAGLRRHGLAVVQEGGLWRVTKEEAKPRPLTSFLQPSTPSPEEERGIKSVSPTIPAEGENWWE